MKASDVINEITKAIEKYGDLDIFVSDDYSLRPVCFGTALNPQDEIVRIGHVVTDLIQYIESNASKAANKVFVL